MADIQSIPKVFESFISQQCTEDIEILKLSKVNFMITQEEAHKDLDIFQYIMDNSYSGREYWQNHGVDFNKIYENIRSFINSHNQIHKSELYNLYYSQLKGIHDGHLSIMSHGTCGRFQCNYKAYFSDVLLEKIDDAYEVIYSSISDILVGNRFNLQQLEGKLFKTLSPTGKEHYLLGCRSWEAIDVIYQRA